MPDNHEIEDGHTETSEDPQGEWVHVNPPVPIEQNHQQFDRDRFKREKFAVTDQPLTLRKRAQFKILGTPKNRKFDLTKLAEAVPGQTSPEPDINRNPYNFVELPGSGPWLESPNAKTGKHHGHQSWRPDLHHGFIEVELTPRTPIFTPVWQERKEGEDKEEHQKPPQDLTFYKLNRWENSQRFEHLAIPGASFKGAVRSMVEALANDRFGVILDPDYYGKPIPYRRRAFQVGWAKLENGRWTVSTIPFGPGDKTYDANLLAQPSTHKPRSLDLDPNSTKTYTIPSDVLQKYEDNLDHPHYRRHFDKWQKQFEKDSTKCKPKWYKPALSVKEEDREKKFTEVLSQLHMPKEDGSEVLIFFTGKPRTSEVDSFGKNVNYLWPSLHSVHDLAGHWFPPEPSEKKMGLDQPLGLAERMFGFVSNHGKSDQGKTSHPFRGKLRFEPLWGPPAAEAKTQFLKLAPLTGPESRAKCRPLYLVGKQTDPAKADLTSASYSDNPKPKLRGRKFYWKQRYDESPLWPFHNQEKRENDPAAGQCPPPIQALLPGDETKFNTRIHFENLCSAELGVLLYALLGIDEPDLDHDGFWQSGSHSIHLGKGKPRGLGVCRVRAKLTWFHPENEYETLTAEPPDRKLMTQEELAHARQSFANWCQQKAGAQSFGELPHIRDFVKLHTLPDEDSVRYYPVNWSDYSWLPKPRVNPDEPEPGPRPTAMKPARELEP